MLSNGNTRGKAIAIANLIHNQNVFNMHRSSVRKIKSAKNVTQEIMITDNKIVYLIS